MVKISAALAALAIFSAAPGLAATLRVPGPTYRYAFSNGQGETSETPVSGAYVGPNFSIMATATAGASAGLVIGVGALGPNDSALFFPTESASVTYYFGVDGAVGTKVPVDFFFSGSATAVRGGATGPSTPFIRMDAYVVVNGEGVGYSSAACADSIPAGCPAPSPGFGSTEFMVTAGDIYSIDLVTSGVAQVACAGCGVSGSADMDPFVRIDPSFEHAADFQLVISAGVGNIAPGTPEPSTWAMMLIGFAGLGYASYRRARASSAG